MPTTTTLRTRRVAVLLALVGAGLMMLASTRTWAQVSPGPAFPGAAELTVPGRRAAPALVPIAVVAALGALVLAVGGRLARVGVALGLVLLGGAAAAAVLLVAPDRAALADVAVQDAAGIVSSAGPTGLAAGAGVVLTGWGPVAVVGAALVGLAGLLALTGGPGWAPPTRRYERDSRTSDGAPPRRPGDPAGAEPAWPGAVRASGAVPADNGRVAAWDALSRGHDPTSDDAGPG